MSKTKFTKRQVANIIRDAANKIETFGWITGDFGSTNKGFCAVGALTRPVVKADKELAKFAIKTLEKRLPNGGFLYEYNDFEAKDEKDVIKLFRRTAYELDHGGSL